MRILRAIKVYDRKFELVREFTGQKARAEFESFANMKPRTSYYHWNKGEYIIKDSDGTFQYQVRFEFK